MDAYKRLRTGTVLHRAWSKVRTSGLSSESQQTKQDTRRFEKDWLAGLERIRGQLKDRSFVFEGEKGITPPKGKGKSGVRPIVLTPIANRIVRRAILEVLQGYGSDGDKPRQRWAGFAQIRKIMDTPTSIGGIPERGVPLGLAIIDRAIGAGSSYFVRSDIKNFFTRIPKADVSSFIREAVDDDVFADFFDQALATNLENQEELEERNHFKYFPNPEIGVAQGSALSALAGNIVLREFDASMNGRGITCVRYIDDFILLGNAEAKIHTAYDAARKLLRRMGMDVYELTDEDALLSGKVDAGNIFNGTDILGYKVSGHSRQPSSASCEKFLAKLDRVVSESKSAMQSAVAGTAASHTMRYHPAMVALHEIIWGWSQSFKYTTAKQVFEKLDVEIEKRTATLHQAALKLSSNGDYKLTRRVMGPHLLADTPQASLADLLKKPT
jgi:hypothetical protein